MNTIKAIEDIARATGGVVTITASAHKDGRVVWVASVAGGGAVALGWGETITDALAQCQAEVDEATKAKEG